MAILSHITLKLLIVEIKIDSQDYLQLKLYF
jgi:hypothetical protein